MIPLSPQTNGKSAPMTVVFYLRMEYTGPILQMSSSLLKESCAIVLLGLFADSDLSWKFCTKINYF